MLHDAVLYALMTEPSPQRVKDDATFSAFDGTRIVVSYVKEDGEEIESAMRVCISGKALVGLKDVPEGVESQFTGLVVKPPEGFQVAIQFNIDTVDGDKEAFARKVSLLKHFCVGAPLYKQFQALATGNVPPSPPVEVHHRPNESYWIVNAGDKVIVAHSMQFVDNDEKA